MLTLSSDVANEDVEREAHEQQADHGQEHDANETAAAPDGDVGAQPAGGDVGDRIQSGHRGNIIVGRIGDA